MMTRNKRFHTPNEYDISWSSSGSEDEDKQRNEKRCKWINLRTLTPKFPPGELYDGKKAEFSRYCAGEVTVAEAKVSIPISRNRSLEDSPLMFTTVGNESADIFSSRSCSLKSVVSNYNISPVKSQLNSTNIFPEDERGATIVSNPVSENINISVFPSPSKTCLTGYKIDCSEVSSPTFGTVEEDLSPVINVKRDFLKKSPIIGKRRKAAKRKLTKPADNSQDLFPTQYPTDSSETLYTIDSHETQNAEQNERIECVESQRDSSIFTEESMISGLSLKSPAKSLYEIDAVSSQDADGIASFRDEHPPSEFDESRIRRPRYRKGGFASRASGAIKHRRDDVHIWRHEVYLKSTSGDSCISCVRPELVLKFTINTVEMEFGRMIARCSKDGNTCYVLMENCDENEVQPGREFRLFPPYAVKEIVKNNVCCSVYLSVTKVLFECLAGESISGESSTSSKNST